MNITDPEHAYALAAAVNGHLRLGSLTQLIPEANDAGRVGAVVLDEYQEMINFLSVILSLCLQLER